MQETAQECTQQRTIHVCMRLQTWPTALAAFLTNYEFVTVSQSDSRLFLLVNMGPCRHCIEML